MENSKKTPEQIKDQLHHNEYVKANVYLASLIGKVEIEIIQAKATKNLDKQKEFEVEMEQLQFLHYKISQMADTIRELSF